MKPRKCEEAKMTVMDVIYMRHAVRAYVEEPVDRETITTLLMAAVHAPTAMHEEPWVFTIIQDKDVLKNLSDDAKKLLAAGMEDIPPEHRKNAEKMVKDPDFNIFYNAGTLMVIWAKPMGPFVTADCWLAAENLMLAACEMGLGTCVIGFAVSALNTPQWESRLGLHGKMTAVAPIIIGYPDGEPKPVARKKPEIAAWLT